MYTLVVGGDSHINMPQWGVSVAQSNHWDVDVGSLAYSLMIGSWVSDNDETWLAEIFLQETDL